MELNFTLADQRRFAELSGDHNPIHVDPVAARRLLFGQPVVHGMHLVLAAFDRLGLVEIPGCIKARFLRPSYLNTELTLRSNVGLEGIDLTISDQTGACAVISLQHAAQHIQPVISAEIPKLAFEVEPRVLSIDDIDDEAGEVALGIDVDLCRYMFPNLAKLWPPRAIAELLATTRLVGMIHPGLNSLFNDLDLRLIRDEHLNPDISLHYRSSIVSRQLRLTVLNVQGSFFQGKLRVFVRPAPVQQPTFNTVQELVGPNEFKGINALVVGGSRGVGEIIAKLLSAGGAGVHLTYAEGKADATKIVQEIIQGGGSAKAIHLDVTAPLSVPNVSSHRYDQIYYCAAPRITRSAGEAFDAKDYEHYRAYFVEGMKNVVKDFSATLLPNSALFCPSSVFLDRPEPGFAEYTKAKEDSEALCNDYVTRGTFRLVCAPRLPRLRTDQISSLIEPSSSEPLEILHPWVRAMGIQTLGGKVTHLPPAPEK